MAISQASSGSYCVDDDFPYLLTLDRRVPPHKNKTENLSN